MKPSRKICYLRKRGFPEKWGLTGKSFAGNSDIRTGEEIFSVNLRYAGIQAFLLAVLAHVTVRDQYEDYNSNIA